MGAGKGRSRRADRRLREIGQADRIEGELRSDSDGDVHRDIEQTTAFARGEGEEGVVVTLENRKRILTLAMAFLGLTSATVARSRDDHEAKVNEAAAQSA